jgi:hypothetical protein
MQLLLTSAEVMHDRVLSLLKEQQRMERLQNRKQTAAVTAGDEMQSTLDRRAQYERELHQYHLVTTPKKKNNAKRNSPVSLHRLYYTRRLAPYLSVCRWCISLLLPIISLYPLSSTFANVSSRFSIANVLFSISKNSKTRESRIHY